MTNATDELRRMLDERGVEWKAIDGDDICFTEWWTHGGAFVYTARESLRSYGDNDLRVETCGIPRSCLIATHEQAIAATLGSAEAYTREEVEGEFVTFVPKDKAPGDTSDGYHTFDELYEHRTGLLAALCNVLATLMEEEGFGAEDMEGILFKSWHHHDGEMYDGMFIVGINCSGVIGKRAKWATWHCEAEWWDRFAIPEVDRAPEWDGHTPADALARLLYGLTPQAVKHVASDELGVEVVSV